MLTESAPGRASTGRPPAVVTRSGTQWPAVNAGAVHSSTSVGGVGAPATAVLTAASRPRHPATTAAGGSLGARRPTERHHRVEHLVEGHRVERDHLGTAAEIAQGIVDLGDVDRTHGTQVLGHDHRRVEVGEGAPVESVEVLAGGEPLFDDDVDLTRGQPGGQAPTSTRCVAGEPQQAYRTRTSPRRPDRRRRGRTGSPSPRATATRSAPTHTARWRDCARRSARTVTCGSSSAPIRLWRAGARDPACRLRRGGRTSSATTQSPRCTKRSPSCSRRTLIFLGVSCESQLAGVLGYRRDGDAVDIDRLTVDPPFFRRGLASKMLRELFARERDATRFTVSTGFGNHPAIGLYERFGFRVIGEAIPTPGVRIVLLQRGQ